MNAAKRTLIKSLGIFCIFSLSAISPGQTVDVGNKPFGGHLSFSQRTQDWVEIDINGGKAEMEFSIFGQRLKYKFSGENMVPGQSYSLLYYPDASRPPQPIDLGTARANHIGKLYVENNLVIPNIDANPERFIRNFTPLLVLSDDLRSGPQPRLMKWNPARYLVPDGLPHNAGKPTNDGDSFVYASVFYLAFMDVADQSISADKANAYAQQYKQVSCDSDHSSCKTNCNRKQALSIITIKQCLAAIYANCLANEGCGTTDNPSQCYTQYQFDLASCNASCDSKYLACMGDTSEN